MFTFGYTLLLFGLTGFCGLGLAAWALPSGLRRYRLLFAPWFGLAYLGAVVYLCYRSNLPGTDRYAGWLLLPPLALAAWALRRDLFTRRIGLWVNRETGAALIPVAAAVLLFGALYLRLADFPTSLSIGNNDIGNYSLTALLVKEHARNSAMTLWGPCAGAPIGVADVNWSLPPFLIAVAASLFHRQPHELATLAVNTLFALTVALFYPFCRRLGLERKAAVWLGLVYAASPLMGNVTLNGLAGEITGIGFLLMAVTVTHSVGKNHWGGTLALVAAFVGLLFGYGIGIPAAAFLAGWLGVGDAAFATGKTAPILLRRAVWRITLALVAALMFCGPRVIAEVCSLVHLTAMSSGWFVPWLSPAVLLGYFMPLALRTYGIPLAALFLAVLIGAALLPKARRQPAAALLALGYLGLYLLLCGLGRSENQGFWGGYKSFKFATFLFPLFLAASALVLRRAGEERSAFRAAFPLLCGLALFGAGISDLCAWRAMPGKLALTPNLIGLRAVNARADIISVTMPQLSLWESDWICELLSSKRLYVPPERVPDAAVAGNWDLLRLDAGELRQERQIFIVWTGTPRPGDLLRVNSDYGLRRHLSGPILAVVPERGWWPDEKDHRWTGSAGRESSAEILCARDGVAALLAFTLELSPGETVAVSCNGQEVAQVVSGGPQRLRLLLHQGTNEIVFRSNLDPIRRFPKDRRLLGTKFTQWTVEESR